jgi:hypothetical protein
MKTLPFRLIPLLATLTLAAVPNAGKTWKAPWKTESEFRKAEAEVLRKSDWVIRNPQAKDWNDSLHYVVEWGNRVTYLTFGTNAPFEKEIASLNSEPIMGHISAVLLVGYIGYGISHAATGTAKREMAKQGILGMVEYYRGLKRMEKSLKIPVMEKYDTLVVNGSLDKFVAAQIPKEK